MQEKLLEKKLSHKQAVMAMAERSKIKQNKISQLIPNLLHDRGWEVQLDLHSIFPRWKELVGEEMSEYAQPLKIERSTMIGIETSNLAAQRACRASLKLNGCRFVLPMIPSRIPQAAMSDTSKMPGRIPPMKSFSIGICATIP